MHVNEDGTVVVATGSLDIGGSRASMTIMAAETLGIDYNRVRPIVADTASVGYAHLTGGSRVTFATGMAVVEATQKIIQELCVRAAKMWDVDPEGVVWEDGCARPASSNVGDFKPLSLNEIAAKRAQTGAPIVAAAAVNPSAVAPGFATQRDVEVDPETGKVKILDAPNDTGVLGDREHTAALVVCEQVHASMITKPRLEFDQVACDCHSFQPRSLRRKSSKKPRSSCVGVPTSRARSRTLLHRGCYPCGRAEVWVCAGYDGDAAKEVNGGKARASPRHRWSDPLVAESRQCRGPVCIGSDRAVARRRSSDSSPSPAPAALGSSRASNHN